ncbi:MAG: YpmA family protein [Firmicutes bacterium]|nr:YpmA family protein [Bacillota bacterium]
MSVEENPDTEVKLTSPTQLTVLASKQIAAHPELYKIVDLCNRTLRDRGLIFGLSKTGDKMTVTIYEA